MGKEPDVCVCVCGGGGGGGVNENYLEDRFDRYAAIASAVFSPSLACQFKRV